MTSSPTPNMETLKISEPPRLDTLPTDILFIIFGYLDTARSVAHLAATCKGLHQLILVGGWRIFVTSCFSSLTLPKTSSEEDWAKLARVLTAQSRDWDRRAFIFHSLSPLQTRRPNGRRVYAAQSIPGNIIVDAHMQRQGHFDEEIVVWGAGEDVLARNRRKSRTTTVSESWHCHKGSETGFAAGKDDTTAIKILKSHHSGGEEHSGVVVGRANGDLRLLSVGYSGFGHTLMQFRPRPSSSVHQREIQAIDVNRDSGILAAGTRENVLLYSIPSQGDTHSDNGTIFSSVDPITAISLKDAPQSSPFDFIRSITSLNKETIAVALNRSFNPIHVLNVTPTGLEVSKAARMPSEYPHIGANPRTVRALLPVDVSSVAHGGGNVMLSSWDDGTIRLQDLRTPSLVDRVYQDNFEVATPINALISHGLERFVAGSAYSHMLKIFDFRWPRRYYHTDSLPCTNNSPYPIPKPPTIVDEPKYHDNRPLCDHILGRLCRWHALSRYDFYRPNCNIYLPFRNYASSPIYSLAKPSDVSPTIYAGLSGLLVEVILKSGMHTATAPDANPLYVRQRGKVAILETGDGSAILDISKCQRVPEIRRQSFSNDEHDRTMARRQHRLDEALQDPREWQEYQPSVS
ncbi:hypothetical protein HD806DRAFT_359886 [Xylariaceae sp. AK1471]|nr:hypothetical protein HD806DRAFT_359886 [Xylariaceae sp. AK1471]